MTNSTLTSIAPPPAPSRAAGVWLTAAQLAAAGLLALALAWARVPGAEGAPAQPALYARAPFAALALVALVVACVPAWRRGAFAGAVCGAALALACALTAMTKFWMTPQGAYVPLLAFIVPGAAGALAVWGALARGGLRDAPRLGAAALVAGLGLAAVGTLCFLILTRNIAGLPGYQIEAYQFQELLAGLALYPAACWVGSVGIRPRGGLALLPLLTAVLLGGALLWWNR
ncbi:MAG TPA: hypothetical protein PK794_00390 [Armatimonadota bacterium]|nr:hypothetical protein [Armatimonadota bacterium]